MLRTKKILRDSVREYRGISLRAPVYVTLESIMECVIPFLMAMLIDYGIDGNNGAGDIYEIRTPEGKTVLFPAVEQFLKQIDPAGGVVRVKPIGGMFDDAD